MTENISRRLFIHKIMGAAASLAVPAASYAMNLTPDEAGPEFSLTLKEVINYLSTHNIIHDDTSEPALMLCMRSKKKYWS